MRKTLAVVGLMFATMLCTGQAHAWNCTNSLAERVPVAAGTAGTFGDGDGQLFLGKAGEGVAGQLYECEVVPPGTTAPAGSIITNTNSANASSNSNSNSTSSSSSKSSASGGNASATGGNANVGPINTTSKATGGAVTNSGNSSNTNTNTATGGAGGNSNQKQTQSASSAANNNGNGNGNGANNSSYSSTTNVAADKIPVASAIAPPVIPTSPCFKGVGVGVQTMAVGASFGGGKVDENCAILEASRLAPSLIAKCKVYISNKYVKKAGVTLDDCLAEQTVVVEAPPAVAVAVPAPAPQIVVNIPPQPAVIVPAPIVNVIAPAPAPTVVVHAAPRKHVPCVPTQPNTTCKPDKKVVFTDDGNGHLHAERAEL